MMTGAEAIVKSLEKEGVSIIFGYPGATIAPFYDKLIRSEQIRHILVRHEQHAGHAASGFARMTGKPAVCVTTSGPGAANLITGLATAYMDSVPLVAITGQVSSELLGRDVFQEADITGATESFTKYSYLVKDASELPRIIKEAFHIAGTGRPGPVLIDVPVDIQNQKLDFAYPDKADIRGYKPTITGHAGQIKRLVRAINNAERPLFCAGGGIFYSQAGEALRKAAEMMNIPIVSTMMGIGAVPTNHPLYMGMVGSHGRSSANKAISRADLLIIVGARVSDRAMILPAAVEKSTKIAHIDIDPAEIGKNMSTSIPIVGDIKEVLNQVMEYEPKAADPEWMESLCLSKKSIKQDVESRGETVNPRLFIKKLCEHLPQNAVYTADVGQNQIWSAIYCEITDGRFLTSGGMGTMGYSVPAAVGAKLAMPDRTVVAVCGDGSFQMQMMELATIVQHDVDVKIVVMNNGKLGLVKEIQKNSYKNNQIAVDLSGSPDFTVLAGAYGVKAEKVTGKDDLDACIDRMLGSQGPYLLECTVDPEETSKY